MLATILDTNRRIRSIIFAWARAPTDRTALYMRECNPGGCIIEVTNSSAPSTLQPPHRGKPANEEAKRET